MATDDLEDLIARTALGDRAAFGTLYDRTAAKLLGVSLRILSDRASAEDVVQETFIKVWHKADTYVAGRAAPMTWLITIARNTAIDRLRARGEAATLDAVPEAALRAPGPSPEAASVAASEARRIVRCLDELEADRRAAVRGAYLMGESYADLARRFDVPLNTMRSWLRRSLIALRDCLAR
ncbi:sigma-70 family RNA polymerase sigma factor [Rhodobacteraceae bacterium CCMM004]|nr:sigma-70 family RNA polymerase sigma factor [Rhodobacteraceae bacterium CCMM004]